MVFYYYWCFIVISTHKDLSFFWLSFKFPASNEMYSSHTVNSIGVPYSIVGVGVNVCAWACLLVCGRTNAFCLWLVLTECAHVGEPRGACWEGGLLIEDWLSMGLCQLWFILFDHIKAFSVIHTSFPSYHMVHCWINPYHKIPQN